VGEKEMKTRTKTFIFAGLFTAILVSSIILLQAEEEAIKFGVRYDPRSWDYYTPPPTYWNAIIGPRYGYGPEDIDPATILLEDQLEPVGTQIVHHSLVASFDGEEFKNILVAKLPHTEPGRYRIDMKVSGALYDGTKWYAIGTVTVVISEGSAE
jgi:hypothetical protein